MVTDESERLTFHHVNDPKTLIRVLEERKPLSCYVYNQVMVYDKFKEDLKFHILGKEISSETWIVAIYKREDWGSFITISAPTTIVNGTTQVSSSVMEAFSQENLIDWDSTFIFMALAKPISAMLTEISVNIKGNLSEVHPCILYYVDKKEALNIKIEKRSNVEVRPLKEDESDFILKSWEYSREGSDLVIKKSIKGAASAGVFMDGKCVSGVITPGHGLISMLYTLKEYRNQGLAKLTMKYAFQENARIGCIPCSIVEARNKRSIIFHQSLGVKEAGNLDSIIVKGSESW